MRSQVSFGTRLMFCVGSMLALTILLGWAGLRAASTFKARYDFTAENTVRKIELADQIVSGNLEMISAQDGMVVAGFSRDAAELRKSKKVFNEAFEGVQAALAEIKPLISTAEGKALTADLVERTAEWRPRYEDFARLAAAGRVRAADRIRKEVTLPIYSKIAADGERLSAVQRETLAADKAELARQYSSTRWIAFSLLGLSLLAGSLVGVVVRGGVTTLRNMVAQLSDGGTQLAAASGQIASASQSLSQGSSEQAASLEEISASMEEMTAMTARNAENSDEATAMMTETVAQVERSNQALAQMMESMTAIKTSSEKVARINKTIDEIAFQTNILALNAAVEAARAGEAGMGFAVVADEVRNLAQRSAVAAKDTAALIEESIGNASQGGQKLEQVADAIRGITGRATKVKNLVDEVNEASKQQTQGIQQVSIAITQVSTVTQTSAASAEESAAASEQLSAQSKTMHGLVAALQLMVEGGAGGEAKSDGRPRDRSLTVAAW